MTSRLERRLTERKKSKFNNWLIVLAIILMILVVAAVVFWFSVSQDTINKTPRPATSEIVVPHKINILVLGVDKRNGDNGRSDTILVATVDTNTKAVSLLSIPRDTWVYIPGYGYDKINHAYSEGGWRLSRQTVEELLGVPMDYYVVVDFAGFSTLVDAIGGVELTVDKRMYYVDPYDDLIINIPPGRQLLDGETAIKYVRYRDEQGDIGRIERQQKFAKAVLEKVTSPAIITRIPSIIRGIDKAVTTDMSTAEMLRLAKMMTDAYRQGLQTDMVPGLPVYIKQISYWLPDIVALRKHVAQLQGVDFDAKYRSEAEKLAAQYEWSIPEEGYVVDMPEPEVPKGPSLQEKTDTKQVCKDSPKKVVPKKAETPTKEPAPVRQSQAASGSKDKNSEAPSVTSKPAGEKQLRAVIVNASGNDTAGEEVAAILRQQGFTIANVSRSKQVAAQTVVTSHSINSSIVSKVTNLPFRYALQIKRDDDSDVAVTVIIGKDYLINNKSSKS